MLLFCQGSGQGIPLKSTGPPRPPSASKRLMTTAMAASSLVDSPPPAEGEDLLDISTRLSSAAAWFDSWLESSCEPTVADALLDGEDLMIPLLTAVGVVGAEMERLFWVLLRRCDADEGGLLVLEGLRSRELALEDICWEELVWRYLKHKKHCCVLYRISIIHTERQVDLFKLAL